MPAILHVDMDAFFAAVEVRDNPSLKGTPLVVGAAPEVHGVVAAASYEARAFGIRSAMPMARALALCPSCLRVEARHRRYEEISEEVFTILRRFTSAVEPVSVDEAYLDVTGSRRLYGSAPRIARAIKTVIREELQLTCSIGVATNRLVAKVASDFSKPDGLTVVRAGGEAAFLAPLPIGKLPGIGPKTAESLDGMGIHTLGQLASYRPEILEERFGAHGRELLMRARGEDDTTVRHDAAAKSLSAETTLGEFTDSADQIDRMLLGLADEVAQRARDRGLQGRTITLKLRDDLFRTRTRAETLEHPTDIAREIAEAARGLYRSSPVASGRKVRLLGVALSKLQSAGTGQVELFPDPERERARRAERAADEIRRAMGRGALTRGRLLEGKRRERGRDGR